ncbi:hypothetical protein, partial [Akkermansia sp.]|uniref:hypothetical protein n=1 Tax=Akkermansia sp. TaxID=1872421 RepID=UPI003AB28FB3
MITGIHTCFGPQEQLFLNPPFPTFLSWPGGIHPPIFPVVLLPGSMHCRTGYAANGILYHLLLKIVIPRHRIHWNMIHKLN